MASSQYAVVTGASAGIGADIAKELAQKHFNLVLIARREDKLQQLADSLSQQFGIDVKVLSKDLSIPASVSEIFDYCEEQNLDVSTLVCNAGYSIPKLFHNTPEAEEEAFIRVLSTSVIMLCKRFLPRFINRGGGNVMIVSSLAAFAPPSTGWGGLYGPLKTFMNGFSDSLNANYKQQGITSTAVCPGFTVTEFHTASGLQESMDKIPNFMKKDSVTVAKGAVRAMLAGKSVWLPGKLNNTLRFLCWLLPMGIVMRIANKLTGGRYERQD